MLAQGIEMVRGMGARRLLIVGLSLTGLVAVYLFQRRFEHLFASFDLTIYQLFVAQLTVRFIINDLLMILLIYGIFVKRKYVIFAFYVQLIGIIFILIPYVFILTPYFMQKYQMIYEGPLISFLHRLVVNPLLMILLIPAFFYQEKVRC